MTRPSLTTAATENPSLSSLFTLTHALPFSKECLKTFQQSIPHCIDPKHSAMALSTLPHYDHSMPSLHPSMVHKIF